jgi:hypothetical protein
VQGQADLQHRLRRFVGLNRLERRSIDFSNRREFKVDRLLLREEGLAGVQARGESPEVFPWCSFGSRDVAETSNVIPELRANN